MNEAGPVGGLAYYISPPTSLMEFKRDPIHVIFYMVFAVAAVAYFSHYWIDVSGSSSRDVANQLI